MTTILHTLTGKIGDERDEVIDHPELGRYMLRVPEGTKPLAEGMFKPALAADFDGLNKKVKLENDEEPEPTEVVAEPIVFEETPAPEEETK